MGIIRQVWNTSEFPLPKQPPLACTLHLTTGDGGGVGPGDWNEVGADLFSMPPDIAFPLSKKFAEFPPYGIPGNGLPLEVDQQLSMHLLQVLRCDPAALSIWPLEQFEQQRGVLGRGMPLKLGSAADAGSRWHRFVSARHRLGPVRYRLGVGATQR